MRSHHLSKAVMTVAVVMFFVSLETFAQGYATGTGYMPTSVPESEATPAVEPVLFEATMPKLPAEVADLEAAGFTGVRKQEASATGFMAPVAYFRVNETVRSSHPEWGGAADLVAISAFAVRDPNWLYNGGQMEVVDVSGRTQARVSKPGVYIVVTGPDANKVVVLANGIKAKR